MTTPDTPLRVVASLGADDETTSRTLTSLAEHLAADACSVAILGEFNRGKSSLVNLILGIDLLPVDVVPTTPTVIALSQGDPPSAVLHEADGRSEPTTLDPETLARLQTVASGGRGSDGLRLVEIHHPSVPSGVRLFDTPGVNDLGETDPELLYAVLPWIDLAVVVLDASTGVSRSERHFMEERLLRTVRPELLFIVNKVDRLALEDEGERAEVEQAFRQDLEAATGGPPTLLFGVCRSGHPAASGTREALVAAIRVAADRALASRRRRLCAFAARSVAARAEQLRRKAATSEEEARQGLVRLETAGGALEEAFALFRRHIASEGAAPLTRMIERSLDALSARLRADIDRRIAMSGSGVAAYAEHGLSHDVTAGVQAWADAHVREVHTYLARHRAFTASEFERAFGDAFPLHRAEPITLTLSREEPAAVVDASAFEQRERSLTLMRFGLPAVGSLVLSMIATPLAPIGLAAGYLLADAHRRRSEEELRADLRVAARQLVEQAIARIRSDLVAEVAHHFARLDRQLQNGFEARRSTSRAALEDHVSRTRARGDADERAIRRLEEVVRRLDEMAT